MNENLEANMLTFALERKFSSIIAVDEIDFENLVFSLRKDVHLVTIQKTIEYNIPMTTQEFMLPSNSNKIVKKVSVKKLSVLKKNVNNIT